MDSAGHEGGRAEEVNSINKHPNAVASVLEPG